MTEKITQITTFSLYLLKTISGIELIQYLSKQKPMPLKPLLTNLIKLKKNKKQKVTAKKKEKVDTKIESQLKLIKFLIYGDIKVHV